MNAKHIKDAIKADEKVTFHRHIYGAPHGFEHLPVVDAKTVRGQLTVKYLVAWGDRKPAWGFVQKDQDDWVSIEPKAAKTETNFDRLLSAVRAVLPDLNHYVSTHGPGPDVRYESLLDALHNVEEEVKANVR